ncbi:hypothetical protein H0H93_014762 [Arthromyces matolae]|nr:hypothetical protein H0H93_014762 [Arthromyces matolae]
MRAESLATETNCWLFVAGHSRSAASTSGFLHYESPALVGDAYKATNQLVNKFGQTIEGLITHRKEEVVELNMRYQELSQNKEAAENEARKAQEELTKVADEKEILARLLRKIKSGELTVDDIPNAIDTTDTEPDMSPHPDCHFCVGPWLRPSDHLAFNDTIFALIHAQELEAPYYMPHWRDLENIERRICYRCYWQAVQRWQERNQAERGCYHGAQCPKNHWCKFDQPTPANSRCPSPVAMDFYAGHPVLVCASQARCNFHNLAGQDSSLDADRIPNFIPNSIPEGYVAEWVEWGGEICRVCRACFEVTRKDRLLAQDNSVQEK